MISLAKYDRKDYIVIKEKFVRYTLFKRRFFHAGKTTRGPKILYCLDFGDCLRIYMLNSSFLTKDKKGAFELHRCAKYFKIAYKNGKINVYSIVSNGAGRKIRNISGRMQRIKMEIKTSLFLIRKRSVHNSVNKRFNNIIVNFLKRNEVKFKYNKEWHINLIKASYPCLREIEFSKELITDNEVSASFSPYFRKSQTFKEAMKRVFGNSGKQISKLIYQDIEKSGTFKLFQLGALFKGIVSFDHIMRWINDNASIVNQSTGIGMTKTQTRAFREIVRRYNTQRVFNMFNENRNHFVRDALNMYINQIVTTPDKERAKQLKVTLLEGLPERPDSFQEIHDYFSVLQNRRRAADLPKLENLDLDLIKQDKLKDIDGVEISGLKIIVPKTSNELREWGVQMHNCIGNYDYRVKNQGLIILGVEIEGKLCYNISIRSSGIEQFYGPCNQQPDPNHKSIIIDYLIDKEIVKPIYAEKQEEYEVAF